MVPAHERTLEIAFQYTGDFYASSFDHDAIRAVREIDPSVDIAPIFGSNVQGNVEVTRELGAELTTARRAFPSIQ